MHPLHRRLLRASGAARWHMGVAVVLGVATAATVIAQALLLARMIVGRLHGRRGRWATSAAEIAGLALVIVSRRAASSPGARRWPGTSAPCA